MNIQSLSREQLKALLTVAHAHRERDWLMLLVAYSHGLRVSEVIGLSRDSISDGYLTVERLKGSLKTIQPLISSAHPLLNEREPLIEYAANAPYFQPLFKMSAVQVWRLMQRYGEQAGLPTHLRHPHVLKHSCCAHLIETQPISVVREWVGHKSIASTGFYLRMSADEVARRVQGVLGV